jgi:hypothetical protein
MTTHAISRRSTRRSLLAAGMTAIAATAAVALAVPSQAATPADPPVVYITVDDAGIHAPDTLQPGVTTIHSTSTLDGTDSMAAVRLNDGVSYDEIFGYLAVGDLGSVFQHVSGKGGIAHGGPTNGSSWTTTLTAGNYLWADDEHGLAVPFQVTGTPQRARPPAVTGTVHFSDGGFRLPAGFGNGTWRLHNGDTIQHEIGLVHIDPGHSRDEVMAAILSGNHPTWAQPQGTVNAIGSGDNAWVTFSNLHGMYVAMDYLPMLQGVGDQPVVQFVTVA